MKKRKIYILKAGQLCSIDNKFTFYETICFSSKEKAEHEVSQRIKINKGYSIERDDDGYASGNILSRSFITYNALSTDGNEMRIRYDIQTQELN